MSMPSEQQLKALAQVMYKAIIFARFKAWECKRLTRRITGRREAEIADLLDAIHNIPCFLTQFEQWDDEFFKESFLDAYDRKWSARFGLGLREIYENELK